MKIIYYSSWLLFRIISKFVFRIKVSGQQHIPKKSGFILATNHISYYDPIIVGSWINRQIYFLAKKELFKNKFFAWILKGTNSLPVRRGGFDRKALELSINVITNGNGLTFFPEGTRSKTDNFLDPKPGIGMIAIKAKCPVIPGYI
ncbi:MAG: lysophospholipid acyltransferase family protein, partial [Candidatus Zixiibacteriota bacterium]